MAYYCPSHWPTDGVVILAVTITIAAIAFFVSIAALIGKFLESRDGKRNELEYGKRENRMIHGLQMANIKLRHGEELDAWDQTLYIGSGFVGVEVALEEIDGTWTPFLDTADGQRVRVDADGIARLRELVRQAEEEFVPCPSTPPPAT